MKKNRPVNLDLRTIKQPLPAVSSILHRITGVILFAGIALMLYALDTSLSSPQGFNQVADVFDSFFAKLIAWGVCAALIYHMFAGIKHLVMDFGYCEELESGRLASKVTFIASAIVILLVGVWIW